MGSIKFTIGTTPNPNSIRISLTESVFSKPATFASADQAAGDPLAAKLFAVPGVASVFMMNDFISVNKEPSAEWPSVEPALAKTLTEHFDG